MYCSDSNPPPNAADTITQLGNFRKKQYTDLAFEWNALNLRRDVIIGGDGSSFTVYIYIYISFEKYVNGFLKCSFKYHAITNRSNMQKSELKKWRSHFRNKSLTSPVIQSQSISPVRARSNTLPNVIFTSNTLNKNVTRYGYSYGNTVYEPQPDNKTEDVDEEQIDKFADNILKIVSSLQNYDYEFDSRWNI